MAKTRSIAKSTMQIYFVQRKNLVSVCRLSVKNLIDKACLEAVDESSEELQNFCAIICHILCHRLKAQHKWYASNEATSFWDYIAAACSQVPHNSINNIRNLEKPRTRLGKGRAWLLMALMEKRLSEYLSAALQQTRLTKSYYADGALMLTEEINVLIGILLGLNTIDFSFDIRNEDLDLPFIPVINFTPYLSYVPLDNVERKDVELQELSEMTTSVVSEVFGDDDPTDTWPSRFSRLDNRYRIVLEQKGYLEELVRLRDSQLTEAQIQRKKLLETIDHYENESRKERQQLESVIIELQAQISQLKDDNRTQQVKIHNLKAQCNPSQSGVMLQDMSNNKLEEGAGAEPKNMSKHDVKPSDGGSSAAKARLIAAPDTRSIMSTQSGQSTITVPGKGDDSQSMIPLTGSFTSETSFKASEITAPVVTISDEKSSERPSVSEKTDMQDEQTEPNIEPNVNTENVITGAENGDKMNEDPAEQPSDKASISTTPDPHQQSSDNAAIGTAPDPPIQSSNNTAMSPPDQSSDDTGLITAPEQPSQVSSSQPLSESDEKSEN